MQFVKWLYFLRLSVLGCQYFSIFVWCIVLIENIKIDRNCHAFIIEIIGLIKIMCFPSILAFLRPHTFFVLSLLKSERSTSNFMR